MDGRMDPSSPSLVSVFLRRTLLNLKADDAYHHQGTVPIGGVLGGAHVLAGTGQSGGHTSTQSPHRSCRAGQVRPPPRCTPPPPR